MNEVYEKLNELLMQDEEFSKINIRESWEANEKACGIVDKCFFQVCDELNLNRKEIVMHLIPDWASNSLIVRFSEVVRG